MRTIQQRLFSYLVGHAGNRVLIACGERGGDAADGGQEGHAGRRRQPGHRRRPRRHPQPWVHGRRDGPLNVPLGRRRSVGGCRGRRRCRRLPVVEGLHVLQPVQRRRVGKVSRR